MKKITKLGITLAFGAAVLGSTVANAAEIYLRKGTQEIVVFQNDGKLYCRRTSDDFELCHGMTQQGDVWKGKKMKHPDMPKFMTFNGTVTFGDNELSIKGCAMGNALCDSEIWTKKS